MSLLLARGSNRSPNNSPQTITLLANAAFVLTGVMTTLLGPMLPVLSARWALNDTQAGYLFTAQFAGSMFGVALSGMLVQRYGYRSAIVAGMGVMAVGAGALAAAAWVSGLAAVAASGIGQGLTIPAANLLIAELYSARRGAALNWLNLSWGVGAAACPFAVAALVPSHRTGLFLLGVAGALLLLSLAILMPTLDLARAESRERFEANASIWRSRYISLLGCLFYLYVGTENCIGGWIASYAQRLQNAPGAVWAVAPSLFWISLLAGRALAPAILRRIGERELAQFGLVLASCGVAILLAAHTLAILLVGVAVSGLGLAPVFPIDISMVSAHFGKGAPRVSGLMFALAGLGGATLPGLVGKASTQLGSLKTGLYIPLLGSLTMLALFFLVGRPDRDVSTTQN